MVREQTSGRRGRSRAISDAVRPVAVATTIARTPSDSARSVATFDIARRTSCSASVSGSWWR
jgi:hypothetical protein